MGLTLSRSSRSSTPRRKIRSAAPCISSGSPALSGWKVGGPSWGFTRAMMKRQYKRPRWLEVPEIPGPILRRRLGSNGLVRVRRGAIVRIAVIFASWLHLVEGQREEFTQAMDSWPQIIFPPRVRSLEESGGFLCLDWVTPTGGVILPRRFSRLMPLLILCVGSIQLYWNCTFQKLWEEHAVKFETRWDYHLLLRVERLKLLG